MWLNVASNQRNISRQGMVQLNQAIVPQILVVKDRPPRPNRHLHAASKVTGGSSAKWNLGLNNARGSNLQVEYNGITLNSVTLDQPIVSAEFEQCGY